MDTILTFASNRLFDTFREVEAGGKQWLVVNGVPLVEGVLNGRFVSADEFGAFVNDWNDIPVVLPHPKRNGGSARVPAPDVPVVGRFYNSKMDGKRLIGEYWLDKQMLIDLRDNEKNQDAETILNRVEKNQQIETSTGYWSESIPQTGHFHGRDYSYVDQNIHPDHIALLTQEAGACSLADGCGMNRNSDLWQHGGPGSGNFGHAGRPGKVGGSASSEYVPEKSRSDIAREDLVNRYRNASNGDLNYDFKNSQSLLKDKIALAKRENRTFTGTESGYLKAHLDSMEVMADEIKRRDTAYGDKAKSIYEDLRRQYIDVNSGIYKNALNGSYEERLNYNDVNGKVFFDDENEWVPVVKEERYVEKLVQNVTGSLPAEGKKIYERVYQKYKDEDMSDTEAAKRAWGAVKAAGWYQDKDDIWHKKSKQNQQDLEGLAVAMLLAELMTS